jgi:branched-chain amino acid aminotransferase
MNGITRAKVIGLCRANAIPVHVRNFSLVEAHGAEEAFVTGTFGGQTPVAELDGRRYGDGTAGPVTRRIQHLYRALVTTGEGACRKI